MSNFDIYIYEDGKTRESGIQVPWLPEELNVDTGDGRYMQYQILDLGELNVHSGRNLGEISWESFFPGENRLEMPQIRGDADKPEYYDKKINDWKKRGSKLRVAVPGTNINYKVEVMSYAARYAGAFGDIYYSITLKIRRDLTISVVKKSTKTGKNPKNKAQAKRKNVPKAHITRSGETLWIIAQKYIGGSRWREIYTLNKTVIEKAAKEHGNKSSNGGTIVYPGIKLRIPDK